MKVADFTAQPRRTGLVFTSCSESMFISWFISAETNTSQFFFISSPQHTLTSWPCLKTKHQTHLDVRLKVYVYTYNIMLSRVRASTLKSWRWHWQRLHHFCHFSLLVAPYFSCSGSVGAQVCDLLIWSWSSATLCTHCRRAATLHWQHSVMQEGMRATTTEGRKVTWKSGVGERCQE